MECVKSGINVAYDQNDFRDFSNFKDYLVGSFKVRLLEDFLGEKESETLQGYRLQDINSGKVIAYKNIVEYDEQNGSDLYDIVSYQLNQNNYNELLFSAFEKGDSNLFQKLLLARNLIETKQKEGWYFQGTGIVDSSTFNYNCGNDCDYDYADEMVERTYFDVIQRKSFYGFIFERKIGENVEKMSSQLQQSDSGRNYWGCFQKAA
jgi:hypothetical protein